VFTQVAPRDREGGGGDVARVDPRLWKGARRQDREAARAGAQIEDAPRRDAQVPKEQRDVRPRNDHAAIDIEGQAVEPRFVEQIRCRNALLYSLLNQLLDPSRIPGPVEVGIKGQAKAAQHEERGFVAGVVGAVTVVEAGCPESRCCFFY